jgi:hypothetical protein
MNEPQLPLKTRFEIWLNDGEGHYDGYDRSRADLSAAYAATLASLPIEATSCLAWPTLDIIYRHFNLDARPEGYANRSLSVGDLVRLGHSWYEVAKFGFVELDHWPVHFNEVVSLGDGATLSVYEATSGFYVMYKPAGEGVKPVHQCMGDGVDSYTVGDAGPSCAVGSYEFYQRLAQDLHDNCAMWLEAYFPDRDLAQDEEQDDDDDGDAEDPRGVPADYAGLIELHDPYPFYVGRSDEPCRARFRTFDDAQVYLAVLERADPAGEEAGAFYLDGPGSMNELVSLALVGALKSISEAQEQGRVTYVSMTDVDEGQVTHESGLVQVKRDFKIVGDTQLHYLGVTRTLRIVEGTKDEEN